MNGTWGPQPLYDLQYGDTTKPATLSAEGWPVLLDVTHRITILPSLTAPASCNTQTAVFALNEAPYPRACCVFPHVVPPREHFPINYARIYISATLPQPCIQTGPAWCVVMIQPVSTLPCPSALYLSGNIYRIERLNPPAIWSPGFPRRSTYIS